MKKEFCFRNKTVFHYKSEDKGLISVDRSNKATLLLTIPRPIFKSYAKDLPPQTFGIDLTSCGAFVPRHVIRSWAEAYEYTSQVRRDEVSSLSSMDSGLEAFSHNPADGSIAALAFQPAAYTKCLNQRFLSY